MSSPLTRPARNWAARIHEITVAGLPAVVLENELLRVTVLAGRGGDVTEFCYKPRDLDFTWLAPHGLRGPREVAAGAPDAAAVFLDHYAGGWQEVFPNGGAPATYRGASLAQHGEVAALPWDTAIVADDPAAVEVALAVRTTRMPLRIRKTFRLAAGSPTLTVVEEAGNEAPVAVDAMWGQHIAFGPPFLRDGCRIRLPGGISVIPHESPINPPRRRVMPGGPWPWPVVPAPGGGSIDLSTVPEPGAPSDIVYLAGFTDGWYEITGPDGAVGLRLGWDAQVLPYLWLWQESGDWTGYPWWGAARLVGLEPFSSYPTDGLAQAVENSTALTLAPGQTRALSWQASVIDAER